MNLFQPPLAVKRWRVLKSVGKYLRFLGRAIWFAAELLLYFAAFLGLLLRAGGKPTQPARSRWLQWCARRTLRVFGVRYQATGAPPQTGLLVANHLSYLDILVLVSLTPAVFVSKAEVKHWPVFGWFACLAGTLFVDRTRRSRSGTWGRPARRERWAASMADWL